MRGIVASVVGGALLATVSAFVLSEQPGKTSPGGGVAPRVECPSVGPSGQPLGPGDICYGDGPAPVGSPTPFGPFLLHPAGSKVVQRPAGSGPTVTVTSSDPADASGSALLIDPVAPYTRLSVEIDTWDGEVARVIQRWTDGERVIIVASGRLYDWLLPLDVYLAFEDSLLDVIPTRINSYPAIVEQPATGPAPNVGGVRIAIENRVVALRSEHVDQAELTRIAEEISDREM